ncbi:hypothetical protein CC1G_07791 [Coprinopsis cinerea okayama7|uniref:Uncharacterized protein n=1 Tax=Coprinopsis cinerea (strain Okayama-7 / 130 / ATCC MYA-4618 / FGSC 9003) TaxID=240176 RepID=A8NP22_COPC7|nr:hypothetical protein CC1G_07791 [Coprinopsis cinerea okayama7\|eukprot:XP_001835248.2 hypothetical protein CC1G_07791 [Coprinopsis cinerea okayama7\
MPFTYNEIMRRSRGTCLRVKFLELKGRTVGKAKAKGEYQSPTSIKNEAIWKWGPRVPQWHDDLKREQG